MSPHDPGAHDPEAYDRDPSHLPDHAPFADWDAAYVLGSLSPVDRRAYEGHLATCGACRSAVTELSGMPGLLAHVAPQEALSMLDPAEPKGPPTDLVARVRAEADRRRAARRHRVVAWVTAAAVMIAIAIAVPVAVTRSHQPTETLVLDQVTAGSPLTATIELTSVGWGTKIGVACSYRVSGPDVDPQRQWSFGLWVTTADGRSSEATSWNARNGQDLELDGATAVRLDQIRSVDIRNRDTGKVLLRKVTG